MALTQKRISGLELYPCLLSNYPFLANKHYNMEEILLTEEENIIECTLGTAQKNRIKAQQALLDKFLQTP